MYELTFLCQCIFMNYFIACTYKALAFTNGNLLVLTMRQESLCINGFGYQKSGIKMVLGSWVLSLSITDIVGLKKSV